VTILVFVGLTLALVVWAIIWLIRGRANP
jgi:hypothetical protein